MGSNATNASVVVKAKLKSTVEKIILDTVVKVGERWYNGYILNVEE